MFKTLMYHTYYAVRNLRVWILSFNIKLCLWSNDDLTIIIFVIVNSKTMWHYTFHMSMNFQNAYVNSPVSFIKTIIPKIRYVMPFGRINGCISTRKSFLSVRITSWWFVSCDLHPTREVTAPGKQHAHITSFVVPVVWFWYLHKGQANGKVCN